MRLAFRHPMHDLERVLEQRHACGQQVPVSSLENASAQQSEKCQGAYTEGIVSLFRYTIVGCFDRVTQPTE